MIKSKPLLAVFIVVFIDILAFTLILPYLPLFAEKFGATPAQIGLLMTAFALCQFLAGPTLGRLSDIYGRKPILAISQFGTFIGFVLLAVANSLPVVFLARIIDGITAGNITVAQATIADITPPQDRAKSFAIIGISFGLGFFIGPAISSYLVQFGYEAPAWAAAALSFISVFTTLYLLPSAKIENKPKWQWNELLKVFDFKIILNFLKRKESRSPLLKFFFFNFAFTMTLAGFALYAERRFTHNGQPFGAKEIGYIYTYLGLIGIFIQGFLISRVVNFFGEEKTARLGLLLQGIGYAAYSVTHKVFTLIPAVTLGSLGGSFARAAVTAQVSKSAGPKEQGVILGVGQSLASIAGIIAPIVSGLAIEHASLETWAVIAGLSALLGLIV